MAPATHETLLVERDDAGYATIVFNRPDKLNTLSIRLRQELAVAVEALEADPAVRVLILTGAGRAFSAGLDLDEWAPAYRLDAVATLGWQAVASATASVVRVGRRGRRGHRQDGTPHFQSGGSGIGAFG